MVTRKFPLKAGPCRGRVGGLAGKKGSRMLQCLEVTLRLEIGTDQAFDRLRFRGGEFPVDEGAQLFLLL